MNDLSREEKNQIILDTCKHLYEEPAEVFHFILGFIVSYTTSCNLDEKKIKEIMKKLTQEVIEKHNLKIKNKKEKENV